MQKLNSNFFNMEINTPLQRKYNALLMGKLLLVMMREAPTNGNFSV
ncbi:MAG: hypothetical protein WBC60_00930 [Cognaticolwellia sp.]